MFVLPDEETVPINMAEDINIGFPDEEDDVCRVCRLGDEKDSHLVHPCKCSGSVKYVHPNCLKQWVAQSQKKHCEICGHRYTFTKVYPQHLPKTIPPLVYVRQTLFAYQNSGLKPTLVEQALNTVANATKVNTTISNNSSSLGMLKPISIGNFFTGPFTATYHFVGTSFENWLQGKENTIVGFILRGQVLSISLAAVLVGLILLREWVQQHNWTEAERPPRHVEPDPNVEDWFVLNGVARRQADVIARILEVTRAKAAGEDATPRFDQYIATTQEERRKWVDDLPDNERGAVEQVLELIEQSQRDKVELPFIDEINNHTGSSSDESSLEYSPLLSGIAQTEEKPGDKTHGSRLEGNMDENEYGVRLSPKVQEDLESNYGSHFKSTDEAPAVIAGPSGIVPKESMDSIVDALADYRRFHARREIGESSKETVEDPASSSPQDQNGPSRPIWSRTGTMVGNEKAFNAPELLSDIGDEGNGKGKGKEFKAEIKDDRDVTPGRNLIVPQTDRYEIDKRPDETADDEEDGEGDWEDEVETRPQPALPNIPGLPPNMQLDHAGPNFVIPDAGIRINVQQPQPGGPQAPVIQVQNVDDEGRIVNVDFMEEEDEDGVWDPEDWNGVLEFVGLVGPMVGLVQNLLFALIIMGGAVSVLIGFPMILGKIFLSVDFVRSFISIFSRVLYIIRKITNPVVDVVLEIVKDVVVLPLFASIRAAEKIIARKLGLELSHRLGSPIGFIQSRISTTNESTVAQGRLLEKSGDLLAVFGQGCYDFYNASLLWQHRIATSQTVSGRAGCALAGYLVLAASIVLVAIAGEAGMSRAAAELSASMKQHSNFVKVSFFMTLELVAFPLTVGLLIDLSIAPLFPGVSLAIRLGSFLTSPFGSSFVDWLLGSMFMFSFSSLLGQVRKLTRPGTMFFIRDPADPNFSPVKDIVEKTTLHQLRKLGSSAVMYSMVVFCLFGAVTWIIASLPISFLPLRIDPTYTAITSVPFDLLFLHLALLPTIDLIRPKSRARRLFAMWWKYFTTLYRLTNLVAPLPHPAEKTAPATKTEKLFWPFADYICQKLFGKYRNEETSARVPASDSVVLMPLEQRRKEGGVFVPLDSAGIPLNDTDKLRLLKQDKLAREAGRLPASDYMVTWLPQFWRTRIHVFVGTALLSLSMAIAILAFGPLLVGRMVWKSIGCGKVHDGYSWFVGAYISYGSLSIGRRVKKYVTYLNRSRRLRASIFSRRLKRTVRRLIAGTYGVVIMFGVLPALLGAVIDIYIGGLWTNKNNPGRVLHFWDSWALGIALCSFALGVINLTPSRYPTQIVQLAERFRQPAAKDFASTTNLIMNRVPPLAFLIFLPHLIGYLLVEIPHDVKHNENNAVLFRSVIIPMSLVVLVLVIIQRTIVAQSSNIRRAVIDAEYVVEERVENYVPPASFSGKPGSGGIDTAITAVVDENQLVQNNTDGQDEWEDM
ncbi:uncharacterized protein L203_106367 [Cryptococcus depauperatus CBS 7841]|uniref:RING-type E3 ubiquitin transferase n=1 Tax=Cryptococcus depauperatus CBS 7841 TaxID=1295531 RepID=A0AAJ8JZ36_9TREE